jgi:hypothetical protein
MSNKETPITNQESVMENTTEQAPDVKDLGVENKSPIFEKPKATISVPSEKPVLVSKSVTLEASPLADKINHLRENGSSEMKSIIFLLDQYKNDMSPLKPQTNHLEGSKKQANLYNIIMRILRKPLGEFKEYFDMYLNYFYLNKDDVFGERYVHRFQEDLTVFLTLEQIDSFNRLIDLSRQYCDPATRNKPKPQISLEKSFTNLNGDAVNNLEVYLRGR